MTCWPEPVTTRPHVRWTPGASGASAVGRELLEDGGIRRRGPDVAAGSTERSTNVQGQRGRDQDGHDGEGDERPRRRVHAEIHVAKPLRG